MSRSTHPNKVMTSIPDETMRKLSMIAIAASLTKDEIYSLSLSFAANHDDFFKVLDAYKQADTLVQAETDDMTMTTKDKVLHSILSMSPADKLFITEQVGNSLIDEG